ncbi:SLBB domain-containing protein [Rhizobium tumorigenes]|uniref:SLBB domain-containing protein n=1 Tax=Rhizobium tumorigenes TaxID=2041385 RepID=UPI003BFA2668
MQKRPNASVEVAEYRPFYIAGLVSKPGKYSYAPGLTVIQALSMAGGTSGVLDGSAIGLERDALNARGDMRALEIERYSLSARQSRVDAIVEGKSKIEFPSTLLARIDQPLVARMMKEENDLFQTRQTAVSAEIEALNQGKVLATNQISALKAKATSLSKQIDLATKDMANVNKLLAAGLTVSARSLGASQNLSDLESRSLDVSLATLKAQQDVAKADQDISGAGNKYRLDALTEAAEVRDRLSANIEKSKTEQALLDNIATHSPMAASLDIGNDQYAFDTTIERVIKGRVQTIPASDNDAVSPGDLIRVERRVSAPNGSRAEGTSTPSP